MTLDKSILHGKEYRGPYYKSKRFDKSCRNHGKCPYCRKNRLEKEAAKRKSLDKQIEEF